MAPAYEATGKGLLAASWESRPITTSSAARCCVVNRTELRFRAQLPNGTLEMEIA
jgi:hypothetical protein